MSKKHQGGEYVRVRARVRPALIARLPHPCPRCGQMMDKSMHLDVGHIDLHPGRVADPTNLRLEHRSCNRRHGQSLTSAIRRSKGKNMKKELPGW